LVAVVAVLGVRWIVGTDGGESASLERDNETGEPELSALAPGTNDAGGASVPSTSYRNAVGDDETLAVYRGRPLVVNFWGATCPPCIAEMPEFEEVFQQYSVSDDVAFIGINFGDTADAVAEMVELTGVTFDIGRDIDRQLLTDFGSTTLPSTALVDSDGQVVEIKHGPVTKAELEALVEDLLVESS